MEPDVQEINRNADGTFPKGVSGNPNGRPKGQSLKEYWRQKFAQMTDEEKEAFTAKVGGDTIWRMAEGNPQTDVTSKGERLIPQPILDVPKDDSYKEDSATQ